MKHLAWAFSLGMLVCAFAARVQGWPLPGILPLGMLIAGIATLPGLWSTPDGLAWEVAPSGRTRASIALLALLICASAGTPYGLAAWLKPPVV